MVEWLAELQFLVLLAVINKKEKLKIKIEIKNKEKGKSGLKKKRHSKREKLKFFESIIYRVLWFILK